jgi:hypothetical protein
MIKILSSLLILFHLHSSILKAEEFDDFDEMLEIKEPLLDLSLTLLEFTDTIRFQGKSPEQRLEIMDSILIVNALVDRCLKVFPNYNKLITSKEYINLITPIALDSSGLIEYSIEQRQSEISKDLNRALRVFSKNQLKPICVNYSISDDDFLEQEEEEIVVDVESILAGIQTTDSDSNSGNSNGYEWFLVDNNQLPEDLTQIFIAGGVINDGGILDVLGSDRKRGKKVDTFDGTKHFGICRILRGDKSILGAFKDKKCKVIIANEEREFGRYALLTGGFETLAFQVTIAPDLPDLTLNLDAQKKGETVYACRAERGGWFWLGMVIDKKCQYVDTSNILVADSYEILTTS